MQALRLAEEVLEEVVTDPIKQSHLQQEAIKMYHGERNFVDMAISARLQERLEEMDRDQEFQALVDDFYGQEQSSLLST